MKKKYNKKEILENIINYHFKNLTNNGDGCNYKIIIDKNGQLQRAKDNNTVAIIDNNIKHDYDQLKSMLIFNELHEVEKIPEINNMVKNVNFALSLM